MLAQQSLRDIAHVTAGQTLLINGAGGGVGTLGIQLAKRHGIEVTGVDSTEKLDFLLSVGFDHVIDYSREDFTKTGLGYDVILDVKTTRSPFAYARTLKPHGTYVTVGSSMPRLVHCLMFGRWIAKTSNRHIRILGLKLNKGLDGMIQLSEAGKVVPSIDDIYPLSEVPQAIRRFGEAHHKGKIVIAIRGPRSRVDRGAPRAVGSIPLRAVSTRSRRTPWQCRAPVASFPREFYGFSQEHTLCRPRLR